MSCGCTYQARFTQPDGTTPAFTDMRMLISVVCADGTYKYWSGTALSASYSQGTHALQITDGVLGVEHFTGAAHDQELVVIDLQDLINHLLANGAECTYGEIRVNLMMTPDAGTTWVVEDAFPTQCVVREDGWLTLAVGNYDIENAATAGSYAESLTNLDTRINGDTFGTLGDGTNGTIVVSMTEINTAVVGTVAQDPLATDLTFKEYAQHVVDTLDALSLGGTNPWAMDAESTPANYPTDSFGELIKDLETKIDTLTTNLTNIWQADHTNSDFVAWANRVADALLRRDGCSAEQSDMGDNHGGKNLLGMVSLNTQEFCQYPGSDGNTYVSIKSMCDKATIVGVHQIGCNTSTEDCCSEPITGSNTPQPPSCC